ncbi:MAG: DNA-binding protein [Subtercola sp.]|nr:DNA-binding protein [Subtercola sp.]
MTDLTVGAVSPFALPRRGRSFPAMNQDTAFFWEGTKAHQLLIQRCTSCGRLRHPPGPACPHCHSFEWNTVVSAGTGTLYSFVVQRHPTAPAFDGPAVIVLVELDEGVRVISNVAIDPDTLVIGERLEVGFVDQDEGFTVTEFHRPN